MDSPEQVSIPWYNQDDFPEIMQNNSISVDVLVRDPKSHDRTLGWFHYHKHEWMFLCREVNFKRFDWRYFDEKLDSPPPKKG